VETAHFTLYVPISNFKFNFQTEFTYIGNQTTCQDNKYKSWLSHCATCASPICKSFAPLPVSISLCSHIFKFQIQNSKVMTPASPTCSFKTISNPNLHSNFKFRWAESTNSWSKGCKPRYLQSLSWEMKNSIPSSRGHCYWWCRSWRGWRRYKRFDLFLLFTTYFVRSSHLRFSWHSS